MGAANFVKNTTMLSWFIDDIFQNDSDLYIVLEYMPVGELFQYVKENAPIPELKAKVFFK